MKVRELFDVGSITQMMGHGEYLTSSNAVVISVKNEENNVRLNIRRDSDGLEATSHLRPRAEYKAVAEQLTNWIFTDNRLMGSTLDEIAALDVDYHVVSIDGKMMASRG